MITIVGFIVIGVVAVLVGRPVLAARAKRLEARDRRQARLEAARSAEDIAQSLLVDREMAADVRDALDRELRR